MHREKGLTSAADRQDASDQRIEVTTVPFVVPAGTLALHRGAVDRDRVIGHGAPVPVDMNGEEFTRFRGITTARHVELMAGQYGLLGIEMAARSLATAPIANRPIWWWALASDELDWSFERLEDWYRLA